jgi:hypothetical protein
MKKKILKAVEEAYRKGLNDAKGLNDISPFLLTSQIVAHELANKFCQPHVSGELDAFREWAEDHYGKGYHDMIWEEWERYHAANYR